MKTLDVSDLRGFISAKRKEQKAIAKEMQSLGEKSEAIDKQLAGIVAAVSGRKTTKRKTIAQGRAKKGELQNTVFEILKEKGKASTAELVAAFKEKQYTTSASVVLGRLAKLGLVRAESVKGVRGSVWSKAKSKA